MKLRVSLTFIIDADDRVSPERVRELLTKAAAEFAKYEIEGAVDLATPDDSKAPLSSATVDALKVEAL